MLKSVEALRKANETFESKISEMNRQAADAEAAISRMEVEQVEALTTGDVAGSVVISAKIVAKKAEVAAVRMSIELMTKNKIKGFERLLEDVRIEADEIRIKGEKRYAAQEAKTVEARDAYLNELKKLGAIRTEVTEAHQQFKDTAQMLEGFKPKNERKDLYYKFPLKFDQEPLFKLKDYYNQDSKIDVIGLCEKTQEAAYAGKLK